MRTEKQVERQKHRDSGKYAKVNPCYCCGKSAGIDYCSHAMTDCTGPDGHTWGDAALVLCGKCSNRTQHMVNVGEFHAYRAARLALT